MKYPLPVVRFCTYTRLYHSIQVGAGTQMVHMQQGHDGRSAQNFDCDDEECFLFKIFCN